mmetsp:Transcript_35767/g.83063  ORF Transcript_35767/g.83063 Transcript_35767/m.83063 type:complete len:111 (+) Transcript_35767:167-499(+)
MFNANAEVMRQSLTVGPIPNEIQRAVVTSSMDAFPDITPSPLKQLGVAEETRFRWTPFVLSVVPWRHRLTVWVSSLQLSLLPLPLSPLPGTTPSAIDLDATVSSSRSRWF